jgi:hypothetical protein
MGYMRWRSWLRLQTRISGSIPKWVIEIIHLLNPSYRTIVLGSTQHETQMSTRIICWEVRAAGAYGDTLATPMCRLSRKYGIQYLLQASAHVQACIGIAWTSPGLLSLLNRKRLCSLSHDMRELTRKAVYV